jgi:hypothetical protein
MDGHEIVNLIVEKFGGNRVKFTLVREGAVLFVFGHNEYRCHWSHPNSTLIVSKLNDEVWLKDNYSRWVEGILNNLVRNDAGEMVPRC